ncbi:phosphatase PAP2 family protein [uncultured Limosilactobacillus sp.]|uniref:phosphatase PAP2 family protein n=1 Tax=uncultured Limosilactobacillus sp. TaxID=2837629 RepID=UPI002600FE0A|nr:phosphatase PAP2 family protein [uncultured Limosilactobacillus sp.]
MKKTKILFISSVIIFSCLLIMMLFAPAPILAIDNQLRQVINSHHSTSLNIFFINFTQLFNAKETIIWILITIILSFIMSGRRFAWQVLLTTGSGILLNRLVKELVQRPRPSVDILMHYSGYSFPSGHSSAAALVLGCLILLTCRVTRRIWIKFTITAILILLILAIGFSRIYVGAHYPSDVLAGWCLGTSIVTGFQLLFQRIPCDN